MTVAVNAGNPNYDMFLVDNFPDWRSLFFTDTNECIAAVADGKADCLLISSYRYNNIAEKCEKYDLITISTGVETEEQLGFLKKQGCQFAQGFYFSRPVPADEFGKKFLENGTAVKT